MSEPKTVRLPDDLAEFVEFEADRRGTTEADVLRALVREGRRYREELQLRLEETEASVESLEETTERRLDRVEAVLKSVYEQNEGRGFF